MTRPEPDHAGRRRRLRERLEERGIEAMVVTHVPNVTYLSGFRGSNGQLLITPDREVLLTDARYEERAADEAPGLALRLTRGWARVAAETAVGDGAGRVGFEGTRVSWSDGHELVAALSDAGGEGVSLRGEVEALRARKDEAEIAALARACTITVAVLCDVLADLEPGPTEREVATRLERGFVDRGAEDRAFPSIVAAGPHGARPHHAPSGRPLRAGELVTVDCGARVDGYHADMTRTVALGEPPAELAAVHEVVVRAQVAARAAAVAGADCGEVDAAAREVVEEAGHAGAYLHGVGHGVGLEIHERPLVSAPRAGSLRAGTVITVEPGLYLPGLGGVRIEDTVVVAADGPPRVLTEAPRGLRG